MLEVLRRDRYDSPPWNDTSHDTFRNGFEGWNVSGCYLHNRVHLCVRSCLRCVRPAPHLVNSVYRSLLQVDRRANGLGGHLCE